MVDFSVSYKIKSQVFCNNSVNVKIEENMNKQLKKQGFLDE